MNEASHKRKLVAEVNAIRGGYARRIEDRWAIGVLDLIIKLPGLPILFAEGKVVDGHLFGPTERQFIEGERIIAAGMTAILLGWKSGALYVSPWIKRTNIHDCYGGPCDWTEPNILLGYLISQKEKPDEPR